jgi:hypothetical protein
MNAVLLVDFISTKRKKDKKKGVSSNVTNSASENCFLNV